MVEGTLKKRGRIVEGNMDTDPSDPLIHVYSSIDLEQIVEILARPDPRLNTSGGRPSGDIGVTTRNYKLCLDYYSEGLAAFGFKDTARESRWAPVDRSEDIVKAEIFVRYQRLLELITVHHPEFALPGRKFTLLNVGEGSGGNGTSLYDYLVTQSLQDRIDAWGIDINPDVVAKARERHPGRSDRLYLMNLVNQETPTIYQLDSGKKFPWFDNSSPDFPAQFDAVIASGIFCLKVDEPNTYIEQTFRRMLATSKFGFAVNFMSKATSDWQHRDLRYTRTDDVLDIVARISGEVKVPLKCQIVQEQSKQYEFTAYVIRDRDDKTSQPHAL